jgi:ubiquinone/menaquinone biosynthesis C-methylase UbiE
MNTPSISDTWERGNPYEQYIGRWSRRIAWPFLEWLGQAPGKSWLDVGCGTGALTEAIAARCSPSGLFGVEPSEGFLSLAARSVPGARFQLGSAAAIPLPDSAVDVVVSGLVLNFVPDLRRALTEMGRVAKPGGVIAAYVWDYAGRMELIRQFWEAAVSLDEAARQLHEGSRFALCNPQALRAAFEDAGLENAEVTGLELVAGFASFDEYWGPFLGGQGPAPAYAMSLSEDERSRLKEALRQRVVKAPAGPISVDAGAWAVRATTPVDA